MSAEDTSEPQVTVTSTGDRLRGAREAAGLSLAELSQNTKIPLRHLEALEAGDFSALPGRTYALGFARSYARAVGLSETEIVTTVRAEYTGAMPEPDAAATPTFAPGDPARVPSSTFAWVAGVVALIAAGGGYVWWQNYYRPSVELPSLLPAETPSPVVVKRVAPAPVAAAPTGPVVFTAQQDGVWVRFYDGTSKKILQEKVLARGETYTVPADVADPRVWTGHPQALDITIGGQAVPRLATEMKTMKDVPVTAAALLARAAPSPAPSGTPAGTAVPVPGASAAPTPRPTHRPAVHPRPRHKSGGETVTAGGVLPAGVPLATPVAGGNP